MTQLEIVALYPHKPLAGQKALVTGANSGIGEGIARHLAAAGAEVAVNYVVKPEVAQAIANDIVAAGGNAIAVQGDVSKEDDVISMFQRCIGTFGTLDILVNNAGLQRDAQFQNMTLDQWNLVININLTGQFLCAREALREFIRRGPRPEVSVATGKIIHVSSVHEFIPWSNHVNYATSKGGIMMLMKSLAQEVASSKVRVNSIGPGAIRTPINTSAWDTPEALAKLMNLIPYNRIGEPDDVGKLAVFLASDMSDYITGQTIFIDGGMTLMEGFATGG